MTEQRLPLYEVRYQLPGGGRGAMKVAARGSMSARKLVADELPAAALILAIELIAAGK